ncbi:MAG: hypothetical protein ACU0B1_06025 [Thermohalobaculum sp.]
MGQIVDGSRPGRQSDRDATICDLTGTGVQDTAIVTVALVAAKAAGKGARTAT